MKAKTLKLIIAMLIMILLSMSFTVKAEGTEKPTGQFNVQINLRLPTESNKPIVTMQKIGTQLKVEAAEVSGDSEALYYHFEKLEVGNYELVIQGTGYVTYKQQVEVKNELAELKLTNGHNTENVGQATEKVGVIGLGDVNGDGNVSITDLAQIMLHLVDTERLEGVRFKAADINGDGKVTITDVAQLQLILVGRPVE